MLLTMGRYFFHVKRGQMTILDQVGIQLTDLEQALAEAARRGQAIAAREALNGLPRSDGSIIIDEEFGSVLELPFQEAEDGSEIATMP
jgi:hypothetical protein